MIDKRMAAASAFVIAVGVATGAGMYFINNSNSGSTEQTEVTTQAQSGNVSENTDGTVNYKIGLSDFEPSDEQINSMISSVESIQKYYDDKAVTEGLLSQYGFLYSLSKENVVSLSDIINEGYLTADDDVAKNTDVLLIRPADYNSVIGSEGGEKALSVFTALNTKNGYFLAGVGVEPKMLTAQQYQQLVGIYSFEHGEIKNPKKGEDEYNAIIKAAGVSGNLDVKHIACDDKYAVLVVGSIDDPTDIKEFAFLKENGSWGIIANDLATVANAKQYLNERYPDMELGLLPIYNIKDYGTIVTGFDDYVSSLESLGMIKSGDMKQGAYECGAGNFVYIEPVATGKKLIGHINSQNKLEFFEATSLEDAISIMLQQEKNPPVFILKFDN